MIWNDLILKGVIMNTIKEFIEFRKNGLRVVLIAFIFSITMTSLGAQATEYIPKALYMLSGLLFFLGGGYSLCHFIKEYIKSKK